SVGSSGRIYGATSPGTPLVDPTRVRTDFNTNLSDATAPTVTATSISTNNSTTAYTISGVGNVTLPRAGDIVSSNGRYVYSCSELSITNSGILNINGPVDIIVTTGNATVSGAAYIALTNTSNSTFNLYCPGNIVIGGSGMVNNTSLPLSATIWGTKPSGGTQNVTISGAAAFKGT